MLQQPSTGTTTISYSLTPTPQLSKLELVEKLLSEKHITFREALKLMEKEEVQGDLTFPVPITPYQPIPGPPLIVTCSGTTLDKDIPKTFTTTGSQDIPGRMPPSITNDAIRSNFQ